MCYRTNNTVIYSFDVRRHQVKVSILNIHKHNSHAVYVCLYYIHIIRESRVDLWMRSAEYTYIMSEAEVPLYTLVAGWIDG